uniref:F-box domain-containing protein n=1 Tax=Steinernema glaseri TaxID=37863 RepID=A0A1I8ALC4_9BILA
MDTVPWIFIESVCLRLLDRDSILESTKIPSTWGQICTVASEKIHTLRVLLDGKKKKIYAAAQPVLLQDYYSYYSNAVPLDSVDLKFITNFRIKTYNSYILPNSWKEITLDALQRLAHFIRPVRNERHPLRYDHRSFNTLWLSHESWEINGKMLSMRLPVDSVDLQYVKSDEFFESAGPLYYVHYEGPSLKQSTVDTLIQKFVPIDEGRCNLRQSLSDEQVTKLFEKCAISDKKVSVGVVPEVSTKILDLTNLAENYSEKEVREEGKLIYFFNRKDPMFGLQVCFYKERVELQFRYSKGNLFVFMAKLIRWD